MAHRVALLRGINLGPRNRVAMPELRDLLSAAGLGAVRTYVQSGNVVLWSDAVPGELERQVEQLITERFGLEVEVLVRTDAELAEVVQRNPFADVAVEPKRYQVTFLAEPLGPDQVGRLSALATGSERFFAHGRELYAWHPDGVARSKLWARLGSKDLGVKATSRNWATVTTLLGMVQQP